MRLFTHSLKKRSAAALITMSLSVSLSLVLVAGRHDPALAAGSSEPATAPPASDLITAPPVSAQTIVDQPDAIHPAADQPAVPAELTTFYEQEITWANCDDGSVATGCATITVPLDYNDPGGQTIKVAMKKVMATDGKADRGTLFTNPGGPGNSGVDSVERVSRSLTSRVNANYDIVGFDPRGVGRSTPLTCWAQNKQNADGGQQNVPRQDAADGQQDAEDPNNPGATDVPGVTDTPDFPDITTVPDITTLVPETESDDGAEEEAAGPQAGGQPAAQTADASTFETQGRTRAAGCAENSETPEILDHMDTASVARDMDVMRSVVGDTKLNYLGLSYGTYLGAMYLDLFPTHAGRIILDSAMDPSMTRSQIHSENIAHDEQALRTYAESCMAGQVGDNCPLSGTVDEAMTQLQTFLEGLDAKPLTMDGKNTLLRTTQTRSIIRFMSNRRPEYLPYLTSGLAQAMTTGNGTTLYGNYQKVRDAYYGNIAGPTTPADPRNAAVTYYGVQCSDYQDTGDTASWNAHAADLKASYPISYNMSSAYMDAFCHGWGHTTTTTQPHSVTAQGAGPVIVIGNTADSQTPYPWAVSLASQLDDGHLLTVKDAIHGAVTHNDCAADAVSAFLMDGTLPEEGATCEADPAQEITG